MTYRNTATGELFTFEEVKALFEQYKWEMGLRFDNFDEYLEHLLKTGGLVEIDGLKTMYAILDVPYDYDFSNDTEHHIFEADNMEAVSAELIRLGAGDEHYSVEEYRVDADGEFFDGSDYDTPSNFRKRTAAARSVKEICKMTGMSQNAMADHFGIPRRTFGNWCTGERECPEYTKMMMQELLGLYKR